MSGNGMDCGFNKAADLMKQWKDRITLDNLRLSERYLKGELDVHILFRVIGEPRQDECCAVLSHFKPLTRMSGEGIINSLASDVGEDFGDYAAGQVEGSVTAYSDQGQVTVFADIVKLLENPEAIIPTIVRLNSLDVSYCSRSNGLYYSKRLGFVFGRHFVNRKGDLFPVVDGHIGELSTGLSKCPHQIVEGASQVMNGICNNEGKRDGGLGMDSPDKDSVPSFRVILGSDFVWAGVEKTAALPIEITDVMFGPFDFKPNLVESF